MQTAEIQRNGHVCRCRHGKWSRRRGSTTRGVTIQNCGLCDVFSVAFTTIRSKGSDTLLLVYRYQETALQDSKSSETTQHMDDINHKMGSSHVSVSPRSKGPNAYPALVRPHRKARTLLYAVAVAVTAGIPMASGRNDPSHVLSESICSGVLSSAIPTNNTSNFDWQSVSRLPKPRIHACLPSYC